MRPSPLASKTETIKMEKRKLLMLIEVLNKVTVEFSETKQFIEEHLEQQYLKENLPVEDEIYSLNKSRSKKLVQQIFFIV